MKYSKLTVCFFSPNGSTKKIALTVGQKLAAAAGVPLVADSFTVPQNRSAVRSFSEDDLVIICSPTYAGRLPNKILPDFKEKIVGGGATAVVLVSFGNRSYDSSLAELREVMTNNGFKVIGAAAFACRHVFSAKIVQGRPDFSDEQEISAFADSIAKKLAAIEKAELSAQQAQLAPNAAGTVENYYVPLGLDGKPTQFLKAKPKTHENLCTKCGACAKRCPMGAIDAENTSLVPGTCIKCQACVHVCTKKAKYFDDEAFLSHIGYLEEHFQRRAANAVFV